jgi:hypothetical protein
LSSAGGAVALVILLIGSGIGDSLGFVHAARVWEGGRSPLREIAHSGLWFSGGIGLYWLALYWARQLGIVSPGLQTVLWFAVTIVGVAVITGEFPQWRLSDQILAGVVMISMAALLFRVSSA